MHQRYFALQTCFLLFSLHRVLDAQTCGDILTTYRGVQVKSNSGSQNTYGSCKADTGSYQPCSQNQAEGTGGCVYGLRYECVELVKRFYSLRNDSTNQLDTREWKVAYPGYAKQYINLEGNGKAPEPGSAGLAADLIAFANDGANLPAMDDIIVFDESGNSDPTDNIGHVAIVTCVDLSSMKVSLVEQNFGRLSDGTAKLSLVQSNNGNSKYPVIATRTSNKSPLVFPVKGWLRAKSSPAVLCSSIGPTPVMGSITTIPMPPTAGTFTVTISGGANFNINNVQLVFEGPGCFSGPANPCIVPTNSMTAGSVTSSSLSAPATLAAGIFQVYVQNGSGGPTSQTVAQLIVDQAVVQNPLPAIQSLSPSSAIQNVSGAAVDVSGSGFLPSSVLSFNNAHHAISYISSSLLSMNLSASDVSNTGLLPVSITNPTPGGGTSAAYFFEVTVPTQNTPSITTLTTTPSPTDAGNFNVNITGNNFKQPQVAITGQGCPTQSPCVIPNNVLSNVTSTGLTAPATINVGGPFVVSVQNGTTGPTSNTWNLYVNPAPVLQTLTSSITPPKVGIFNITLNGLNFDPSSARVEVTGKACTPCIVPHANLTSVSSMQLMAPLQINNADTFQVVVRNGTGGVASNAVPLLVQ